MMAHASQLEMERPIEQVAAARSLAGPKSILVHLQNDDTLENRLQNALSLARGSGAHLECLHVTPYQAYVTLDGLGGIFVTTDAMRLLDEQDDILRREVERHLAHEDVSWNYVQITGDVIGQILSHAALADLIVTGREPRRSDFAGSTIGFLGDLIGRSRTPVFLPCRDHDTVDPSGPAIVAWDGSFEATNAVRGALPMLQLASSVDVLKVKSERSADFPGTRLLEYLSRHGIHANLQEVDPRGERPTSDFVAAALMSHAANSKAAYIVMGGYNHSRLGEFIFGGVTRTLLADCNVPLIISH